MVGADATCCARTRHLALTMWCNLDKLCHCDCLMPFSSPLDPMSHFWFRIHKIHQHCINIHRERETSVPSCWFQRCVVTNQFHLNLPTRPVLLSTVIRVGWDRSSAFQTDWLIDDSTVPVLPSRDTTTSLSTRRNVRSDSSGYSRQRGRILPKFNVQSSPPVRLIRQCMELYPIGGAISQIRQHSSYTRLARPLLQTLTYQSFRT